MDFRRTVCTLARRPVALGIGLLAGHAFLAVPSQVLHAAPLTTLEYRVVGQQLGVSPAAVAVPKGIAGSVLTTVAGDLPPGAFVEATLRGPSFPARRLVAAPNQPLLLPPLNLVGDYSLDGIRLIDPATGATLLEGSPSSVPVRVFDEVLVSRVTSRPLSLDEIEQRGIYIDEQNFRALEFEVGFVLDGQTFPVRLPVITPNYRQTTEIIPAAELEARLAEVERINDELSRAVELPPELTAVFPNFEIKGVNFEYGASGGGDLALSIPPIPALMVIPGNIGFLNQFFSVMIFTENAAPAGSGLSVRDITAELILPPGPDRVAGTFENPGDDPLRFARVGPERVIEPVQRIARPGPDGVPGTADDIPRLNPGQTGQAEFLVEGLQEGLHVMDLQLRATLDGLAAGPVEITGKAAGSVLVRNPRFSMAFVHPRTVRVGEPYEATVTILNTGAATANLVSVELNENNISGGILESPARVELGTIEPGETKTATYRIRSQKTGAISFSNLTTSDDSLVGRFRLRGGVDERGVALSPDTILLPEFVDFLPPRVVAAAQRVIGQALSTNTAGQLPPGVRRVNKSFLEARRTVDEEGNVTRSAHGAMLMRLLEAAQRVRYGEDLERVLPDLALDWQGGREFDPGWDQIIRATNAGREWREAILLSLEQAVPAGDAATRLADRGPDLAGRGEDWLFAASDRAGIQLTFQQGALSATAATSGIEKAVVYAGASGSWLAAASEGVVVWRLEEELAGSGAVSVHRVRADGTGRVLVWSVNDLPAGACLRFDPANGNQLLLVDRDCDGTAEETLAATGSDYIELPPRILFAYQDPEILVARPPLSVSCNNPTTLNDLAEEVVIQNYANVLAVLFSKPMTQETVNVPAAYRLSTGAEGAFVQMQPGGRLALLSFNRPFGALNVPALTVSGAVTDVRGNPLVSEPAPVTTRLFEGVTVRGRVIRADGSFAANVPVTLTYNDGAGRTDCLPWIRRMAQVRTDETGAFSFDFVVGGIPYSISATDTSELSEEAIALILESSLKGEVDAGRLQELASLPQNQNTLLSEFATEAMPEAIAKAEGLDRAVVSDRASVERYGSESVYALRFRGRGTVMGEVVLANSNTPVPAAAANLFPDPNSRELGRGILTDSNGRFAFYGVPLGPFSLQVLTPEGLTRSVSGFLSEHGQVSSLRVELGATPVQFADWQGRVTEPDGTPVAGAPVYVSTALAGSVLGQSETDAAGYWTIRRVPTGSWVARAFSVDGRRTGTRGPLMAAPETTVTANVVLQDRAVVEGIVQFANGDPVANATVGGGDRLVTTDEFGRFTLPGVPTGDRTISAGFAGIDDHPDPRMRDTRVASTRFEVKGGANFAVIRFQPQGRIFGFVRDANDKPMPGVNVALPFPCDDPPCIFLWTTTDAKGRYEFSALSLEGPIGGAYDLSAPSPPVSPQLDTRAVNQTLRSGSVEEIQAALGEVFAAFVGLDNPLLKSGEPFNPGEWGFIKGIRLRFDGDAQPADIKYLNTSVITGRVENGQGVPIGARVRLTGIGPDGIGFPTLIVRGERNSDPALGTFEFNGQAFIGDWGLQAASPFFPVVISTAGRTTPLEPDARDVLLSFPPVVEINGSLTGRVLLPDGQPAGEGVEVSITASSADDPRVLRTDEEGAFSTGASLYSLRGNTQYTVTAFDPETGGRAQASARILAGQDNQVTLTLLGRGDVEVLVRRADGTPAAGADVSIKGGQYPRETASGVAGPDGRIVLSNLFAGPYGISASAIIGLTRVAGMAGVNIVRDGLAQATITLAATANVSGVFLEADGVIPVPFANVRLGSLAYAPTDEEGRFSFIDVPLGTHVLTAVNPISGRGGNASVMLTAVNETRSVTIVETPLGVVRGLVLDATGTQTVPNAEVTLRVDDSFALTKEFVVTSGPDGTYSIAGVPAGAFQMSVEGFLPDGRKSGERGTALGVLPAGVSELQFDIAFDPRADVRFQVFEAGGATPAANARVTFFGVPRDTDTAGEVLFANVPLLTLAAIAVSRDPGETRNRSDVFPVVVSGRGALIEGTLVLRGTGAVAGRVFQADGVTPGAGAEVTVTIPRQFTSHPTGPNVYDPSSGVEESTVVGADGEFFFDNLPPGLPIELRARRQGLAAAETLATVVAGETLERDLLLSASGTIIGRVFDEDGSTPSRGASVSVEFAAPSGLQGAILQFADNEGRFSLSPVPQGPWMVRLLNLDSGGINFAVGSVSTNEEIIDLGDIFLDETPPFVVSTVPEDTDDAADINAPIEVLFSEELDAETVNPTGAFVRRSGMGTAPVPATVELLAPHEDDVPRLVRITPDEPLESNTTYQLVVVDGELQDAVGTITNRGPRDLVGRPLTGLFSATFTTRDQRPPVLLSFTPEDGAEQVDTRAAVRLSFDEPIAPGFTISLNGPGGPVAGSVTLGVNNLVLTFLPSVDLLPNALYTATVDGVADLAGNIAIDQPYVSTFATLDTIGPAIAELRIKDGLAPLAGSTILLEAVLAAPEAGARVRMTADFAPLGTSDPGVLEIPYTLPAVGTFMIRAIAIDRFGNEGPFVQLPVSVLANQPPTITFTRINPPSGAVGTGGTFSVRVEAADDGGVAELRAAASGAAVVPLRVTAGEPVFLQGSVAASAGPGAAINILAIATDNSGASSGEQTFSIPLFDNTPPTVTFSEPVADSAYSAGAVVAVILSAGDNFGVTRVEVDVSGAFTFSEVLEPEPVPGTQSLVVEIPLPESTPNDGATFTVSARTFDVAGLASGVATRVLRMRDLVPPRLLSVTPADGAENQPVFSGGWTLAFSRDLNVTTVTEDLFAVVDQLGEPVPFELSLPSSGTVNIQPSDLPLEAETTYTLTILPGFTDLPGNVWVDTDENVVPVEGLSFSFTTGASVAIEPRAGDFIVPGQTIAARLLLAPDSVVSAATFAFNDGAPVSRTVPSGSTVVEQRLTLPAAAAEAILHVTATIAGEVVEFAPVVLAVRPREADDSGDGLPNGWKVDNGLDPFVHDADDPVLFTDNFEQGAYTAEFWFDPDNRWMLSGNRYRRMFASNPYNFSTIRTTAGLTDFDIVLDIANAHDGGILLGSDARGDNGLVFVLNPENSTAYFKLRSNGTFNSAQLGQVAVSNTFRGQGFRLHLSARGNSFSVSGALLHAPDVEIFTTTLTDQSETAALRGGYVGLYSFGGFAQSPVSYVEHFDRIEIRLPDAVGIPVDRDADGLTHVDQFELGTDPRALDTDGDGLADGAEVWGRYGALGWWRGEATTTDVFRIHSGVIQNGSVGYAEGVRGRAFAFDGGSGRIQMLNSGTGSLQLNGEALTIEAWVHQNDRTQAGNGDDAQVIFDKYFDGAPNGYLLYLVNGRPSLFVATGDHTEGISVVAPDALPLNAWVHLAGVYDGTALRLYVDGSEFATTAATGALLTNNLAAAIGNDNGGSTGFGFKGRIDEVAVYAHALPAAHIAELASLERDGRTFVLDPLDADTDGDGIPDGFDPLPLLPNRPPVPGTVSVTANSGLPRIIGEDFILLDASDPDGDVVSITGEFGDPANGTVTFSASARTFSYTSNAGFNGEDSFTYILSDEWGLTATGTITINVDANRPPIAGSLLPSSGGALRFDGVDDITGNSGPADRNAVRSNFTMELWALPTRTRNVTTEANSGITGTGSQRYAVYPEIRLEPLAGAGISIGTNGISVFEHSGNYLPSLLVYNTPIIGWVHVAVVYENNRPRLYVNGELVREGLQSTREVVASYAASNFAPYGAYAGDLDEFRVWDRVLTESEIQRRYTRTVVPGTPNLVAAFNFDEASGAPALNAANPDLQLNLGSGAQAPQRVVSTAPILEYRTNSTVIAGRAHIIELSGADPDGDPLTARVLSLPANGRLFQFVSGAQGGEITEAPTEVADPLHRIVYLPDEAYVGKDAFRYLVSDGQEDSNAAIASVEVVPAQAPSTDDLWDISHGSTVTSHSGVRPDSLPGNMFGGSGGVEPLNTLFAEDRPAGFTHFIEWQTADIVWLEGFNLFANNDSNTVGNRGITEMRLLGRLDESDDFELIATHTVPSNPYFPDSFLRIQSTLTQAFIGQQFRAEFDQFDEGVNRGPRIEEMDAIGWRAAKSPIVGNLVLRNATATASQGGFPVSQTIDGDLASGGWAIDIGVRVPQTAVWETTDDIVLEAESELIFTLPQGGGQHTLGRFRISATGDDRIFFADGLANNGNVTANWHVLEVVSVSGTGGETHEILEDGSILVGGPNPSTTTTTVRTRGFEGTLTGLRLETLQHPSIPGNGGPGRTSHGNFILTEFIVEAPDHFFFNRYPITADLFFDATAGEPLFLSAAELLEGTFDPDGDALSLVLADFGEPGTGLLETAADGSGVTYTAPVGFGAIDSFTYTVRDSNGLSATATVFIDVDFNRAPVARSLLDGYALAFNGSGGEVDLGSPEALRMTGDQTIEMWLKPTDFTQRRNPWAKAYAGEGTITQEMDGRLNYFYGIQGNNSGAVNVDYQPFSSIVSLPRNQWTHVAVVRDISNGILRWYFNGNLVSEDVALFPAAVAGSLPAFIGRGYVSHYAGEIDEVRVWNVARTEAAIAADFRRKLTGGETGLAGYWRMDEGEGTSIGDATANGLTGARGGGANAPEFVPSFVPFEIIPVAAGGDPVALVLDGDDADGDELAAFVTRWPRHGGLFTTTTDGLTPESSLAGAGNALLFEHTRQTVALPHAVLDGSAANTVEFWMRTGRAANQALLSGANAANDNAYLLWFPNATTVQFYTGAGSTSFVQWTVAPMSDDAWRHFAFVRDPDAGGVELFINGESQGFREAVLPVLSIAPGGLYLAQEQDSVGGGWNANENFRGFLDELRVWDHARPAAAIAADWNRVLAGGEDGLRAYYPMDTDADALLDRSGNAFHALLTSIGGPLDGSRPTVTVSSAPTHGGLPLEVPDAEGRLFYVPEARHYGLDTIAYRLSDGRLFSGEVVHPVLTDRSPPGPVAVDAGAIAQGGTFTLINPFFNDFHPRGLPFDLEEFTAPQHGALDFAEGRFVYTPDPGFAGEDAFTYRLTDGVSLSDAATVFVSVTQPEEIRWTNPAGGSFHTASNWSANRVPTPDEVAIIDLAGAYTVTVTADATVGQLRVGGPESALTLRQTGGTLTVSATSVVRAGSAYELAGGTLRGLGTFIIEGALTWTGGNMNDAGKTLIAAGATGTISGNPNKGLNANRILENAGELLVTTPNLYFNLFGVGPNAVINNLAGGTLEARGNVNFTHNSASPGSAVNNAGVFRKTGGGVARFSGSAIAFNNTGAVEVEDGTMRLEASAMLGGAFRIEALGSVLLVGSEFLPAAGVVVEGPGTVILQSGNLQAAHALSIPHFTQNGGTVSGTGTITVTEAFTWTGGTMRDGGRTVIAAGATGTISGNVNKGLDAGRVLENAGTVLMTAPNLYFNLNNFGGGGTIENLTGGVFEAQGNTAFRHNFGSPGSAVNNAGLFRKTGGGATIFSSTAIALNNTGTLEISEGTLRMDAGGTLGGDIVVGPGGTLQLNGGGVTLSSGQQFVGEGTLLVSGSTVGVPEPLAFEAALVVSNGTVTLGADQVFRSFALSGGILAGTGTVTVTEAFTWTGGTMRDGGRTVIAAGATGTISGNVNRGLDAGRVLENAGTVLMTAPNLYFNLNNFGGGGTIENLTGGVFEAQGNTAFRHNFGSPGSAVNNAGLFRKTGGGTTLFSSSAIAFNNAGTLEVDEGTLRMDAGGTLGGDIVVGTGGTLQLNGGGVTLSSGQLFVGEGTLLVSGSTVGVPETFAFEGALNLSSGTVTFAEDQVLRSFALSGGILAGTGTVTVTEAFTWTGGTMRDGGRTVIPAGATGTISGNASRGLDAGRVLENAGTVLMTAPNLYFNLNNFGGGGRIENLAGGVFEAQGSTAFRQNFASPGSAVNNAGLFRKTGGGTALFTTNAIALNNTGTIELVDGSLHPQAGFTQAGTVRGNGTIVAGFTNSGILAPARTPGGLTVQGNLAFAGDARLEIGIGADAEGGGSAHGRLTVTGTATLAGTLALAWDNGFVPDEGAGFAVLSANGRVNEFTTLEGTEGLGGFVAFVDYTATGVEVVTTPALSGDSFTFGSTNGPGLALEADPDGGWSVLVAYPELMVPAIEGGRSRIEVSHDLLTWRPAPVVATADQTAPRTMSSHRVVRYRIDPVAFDAPAVFLRLVDAPAVEPASQDEGE